MTARNGLRGDVADPTSDRTASATAIASRLRFFRRDRSAVAALEFAILAFPFFLIVFAILETSAVFMAEMTLNQAVTRVSRIVRTGETTNSAMSEATFKQKLCSEIILLMSCSQITIDLRSYPTFADIPKQPPVASGTLDTTGFTYELPTPGEIMAFRAYYRWPLFTDLFRKSLSKLSDGTYLVSAVAVFKTEPFSGG